MRGDCWLRVLRCVPLAVFLGGAASQAATAGTLLYSDDFVTHKAIHDSFDHSPVCEGLPACSCLSYGTCPLGGPGLHVAPEAGINCEAHLRYRFPLNEPLASQTEATVTVAICAPDYPAGRLLVCLSDTDSQLNPDTLQVPGSHAVSRQLPQGCSVLYVSFVGYYEEISYWELTLAVETPVQSTTWGRMRVLYR